jgi:hypothetical protein
LQLGTFYNVSITAAEEYDLYGTLVWKCAYYHYE